jgi:mono/diheme cytochrome c family protein
MSARQRRARHGASSAAPDPGAAASAASRSPNRWRRRLAWVAAAIVTSAVVLGGVVLLGCRLGANACIGERVEAGVTGAEIFQRNCAKCHGPAGEGGTGPAFTPGGALAELTFAERVEKTGRGKPLNAMPRWRGKLSPDEIRKVAAYTQALSGQQPEPGVEAVR